MLVFWDLLLNCDSTDCTLKVADVPFPVGHFLLPRWAANGLQTFRFHSDVC